MGFDTPERRLERVACACELGGEGTKLCNYGGLCGSLTVGGRDVGQTLSAKSLRTPTWVGRRDVRRVAPGAVRTVLAPAAAVSR